LGQKEPKLIARIWHGYTTPENAASYEALLKPEVLPGIGRVNGYIGSYFVRRELGAEVEFVTIMLWQSLDAIKAFAGPNYEAAVVPDERRRFLSRWDERSAHYEVISHP
jgi:heme-degrading monooxygenase HmoA